MNAPLRNLAGRRLSGWGLVPVALLSVGCRGTRPELGVVAGRLRPCPDTPNCVSSDAPRSDPEHYVEPLAAGPDPRRAWIRAIDVVKRMPRVEVVAEEPGYLRAEVTSLIFRFVDDLELHARPRDGIIAVRSASRVGKSDLGVNRARVEEIRQQLR